ncbi:uracil phosphoribosyltransferase, chloroplastic isoform X6 [Setaria viridis]|uniref:uracil phosphoribosyltransferase, chloroplastic isoform X6 n=1 Tax=Setaria viridis TaxID=4556 RepID=UPI003B3BA7AF
MQSENSRIWLVELRASRASLSTYLVACLFFAYEATRDCLPTAAREVQTPLGPAAVQSIDDAQPIMIVPILRAGLAFAEQVTSILPSARIFHPGMSRNEETLLPAIYLNKSHSFMPFVSPYMDAGCLPNSQVDATSSSWIQCLQPVEQWRQQST